MPQQSGPYIQCVQASLSHWWWSLVITERGAWAQNSPLADVISFSPQNRRGHCGVTFISFKRSGVQVLLFRGNVEKYLKWYDQIKSFFQGSADGWYTEMSLKYCTFLQQCGAQWVSGSQGWVFAFHQLVFIYLQGRLMCLSLTERKQVEIFLKSFSLRNRDYILFIFQPQFPTLLPKCWLHEYILNLWRFSPSSPIYLPLTVWEKMVTIFFKTQDIALF